MSYLEENTEIETFVNDIVDLDVHVAEVELVTEKGTLHFRVDRLTWDGFEDELARDADKFVNKLWSTDLRLPTEEELETFFKQ